jgi:hypothetical protein
MSENNVDFQEILIVPLEELVQKIASSVAKSQVELDNSFLNTQKNIKTQYKELSDIGYVAPWYHMSVVDVELKMSLHYEKSGESTSGNKFKPFWTPYNAKYKSNFSYDAEGTSILKIKFASTPPPISITASKG